MRTAPHAVARPAERGEEEHASTVGDLLRIEAGEGAVRLRVALVELGVQRVDERGGARVVEHDRLDRERRGDRREGEGVRRWAVVAQGVEAVPGVIHGRQGSGRYPPECETAAFLVEPLAAPAEDVPVGAPVGELLQCLRRLPHREVDDHVGVGEGPDVGGVTTLRLQAPHEPRSGVGQPIDQGQAGDEVGQQRIVERGAQLRHVHIGEVVHDRTVEVGLRGDLGTCQPDDSNLGAQRGHMRTVSGMRLHRRPLGAPTFRRAALLLALTATAWLVTSAVPAAAAGPGVEATSSYLPVTPCRLVDTRDDPSRLRSGPSTISVVVTGRCGVPDGATAAAFTFAVTGTTGPGFVTAYPAGAGRPTSSVLNWAAGDIRANGGIVALQNGAIDVFASNGTDIVIDVTGAFLPAASAAAGRFVPIEMVRALDTRVSGAPLRRSVAPSRSPSRPAWRRTRSRSP